MARKKIAILGGGMAGLSAAYQLSKTQALRDEYDVTVYQMGWRLGGKIASGRDASGRNLEHGLHVWFGCYDNAFRMLQEVYATHPPGARLLHWTDAVKPQPFTPIGVQTAAGWTYWPVIWPHKESVPGQGGVVLTLWEMITNLIGMLRQILESLRLPSLSTAAPGIGLSPTVRGLFGAAAASGLATQARTLADNLESATEHSFLDLVTVAHLWAQALQTDHDRLGPAHPAGVVDLLTALKDSFKAGPGRAATPGSLEHMVRDVLEIGKALIAGVINDVLLPDRPFDSLDQGGLEFRKWLQRHGADSATVDDSSIVRALYDTAFQYLEGDTNRPSYAAGTAVGVITRLIATYKGDMLWEIQTGMGEAVIAPLYRALVAANVQFRFFRKVMELGLSQDRSRIETIRLDRQCETNDEYRPTFDVGGLECWGSEPDWNQLVGGAAMQQAGVDFESHWCGHSVGQELLKHSDDFDSVVLAISMGAYQPLNDEPGMCDQLIAASQRFSQFVSGSPLVPTQAVQLWSGATTAQLGWVQGKPAAVAGPEPLSVWADMTQVLEVEPWNGEAKPASLHYLTGTFATQLYRQPSTQANVPGVAAAALRANVIAWLERSSTAAWPRASDGLSFRWDLLTDPKGRQGSARIDAQYLRANIGPGECCVGSPAGSTRFRLGPDETGFSNLFLAGEATRTGCNTSSVEGAVMSGMAAARAISGEAVDIVGYDFLRIRPSELLTQGALP